ncbi:tRNA uridine(34) 5-carboxymethylaminomethyl modification radical SAM/GNAT enzyme Elp3 [Candidatus Uhrbacteria bacterium]|nr:tRNA uridine(34) 5-carboxymethylaminomethyl modification radical SAM/GNAT enzyme Elp3 [Candidatus Uhrbacteria bacterium]
MQKKSKNLTRPAEWIIQELVKRDNSSQKILHSLKCRVSKKAGCGILSHTFLFAAYRKLIAAKEIEKNTKIEELLCVKKIRSQSGVSILTLLTMPFPCPGRCVYCPTEDRMPKSYVATEPAAARALALKFDPYEQIAYRIRILEGNGHATDKIEIIIKGGTWSSYPKDYQQWFIKEVFRAMNSPKIKKKSSPLLKNPYNRFEGEEKRNWTEKKLFSAQKKNETAAHRCIGLTIETRPDFITLQELKRLRDLGCTRGEIGVQHTDNAVLDLIKRGHSRERVVQCTQLLKDAGFKVDFHLMQGLPGSTPKKDFHCAKDVYTSKDLQPDTIKLYPCVVMETAELSGWLKDGRYTPYTSKTLLALLAEIKAITPPYVRIARVIRDIPSDEILEGNKTTNLRQDILMRMKKDGLVCRCLRCREIGHISEEALRSYTQPPRYTERIYDASGGKEYFLSFESEDEKILYAFLRLRFPSQEVEKLLPVFPELKDASIVRELHTYGHLVPLSKREKDASQHKGYGKKLLAYAESLSKNAGYARVAIIAGIGVREYYKKQGYRLEGTYMVKDL